MYLAEHLGLMRKVALKVLAADLAGDERFRIPDFPKAARSAARNR